MAVSTDVNDPSFGLETDQSSPNFGLASDPPKQESVVGNALAGAGDVIKGFAQQFVPKFDLKTLAGLAYGPVNAQIQGYNAIKSIGDTAEQVQAADDTPAFSRERFGAGFNVVGQLGLLALGGREKPLSEIALGKTPEVSPEAMPQAHEPLAAEVAAKEPIIPEPKPEEVAQNASEITSPESVTQPALVGEPLPVLPRRPKPKPNGEAVQSPVDMGTEGLATPEMMMPDQADTYFRKEGKKGFKVMQAHKEEIQAAIDEGRPYNQEAADFHNLQPKEPAPVQEAQPPTTAAIKPEEAAVPQPEQIPAEQTPALEVTQEPAATAEPLPKEAPTEAVEPTTVVSTPEAAQKPSKIGQSIEAKAVEAKLTRGFAETAGYDPITIADQSRRATEFVKSSDARAVIRGEAPLPEGLRGTSLITAMEEQLLRKPDSQLAHELANSPLTSATSAAAQEMRLMAERVPDSLSAKFSEIREARQAGSKLRGETPERLFQDIQKEIVKQSSKRPTWEAFVREITC